MKKILVIEDEESILMALEDNLKLEGYSVAHAMDGKEGLKKAQTGDFDLIILDIMLPEIDGFEVCRQIRQQGYGVPILMLTAKSQEIDKVLGLELGADDYVTKPFSPRELLARVKALLRRTRPEPDTLEEVTFGDVAVDFKKYELKKGGNAIFLTALEFSLLKYLLANRGRVVKRDAILDQVWGDVFIQPRTVDKHIAQLRKKIEDNPTEPRFILGVRSVGYKFAE